MTDELLTGFDGDKAEPGTGGYLPESMEAIDEAVGEAYLAGELNPDEPFESFEAKVVARLRSKGLMPDMRKGDVAMFALRLLERVQRGESTWDYGIGKKRREDLALYQKLKDRPSVKAVVELGGLCQESFLVIRSIAKIDEALAQGKTYDDVYHSIVYCDDATSNHAFLNHVEERFKTTIKSRKQLLELAKVKELTYEKYMESIKDEDPEEGLGCSPEEYLETLNSQDSYLMAIQDRYSLALDKVLRDGGKYRDLLALNPQDFGLPKEWRYPYDLGALTAKAKRWARGFSKEDMIRKTIFFHFNLGEPAYRRVALRDVADALEAPYSEVLKASKYYGEE